MGTKQENILQNIASIFRFFAGCRLSLAISATHNAEPHNHLNHKK